jgi:DeoR/GlpR family transcriptional regulator of sugar metabolism
MRSGKNLAQKLAIGRAAARLVKDGDSLALDVGTTVMDVAKSIVGIQNLTVVTASLHVANILADAPGIRLIISGGIVRGGEWSMIGHIAERTLRDFRVDKAFIGVGALDLNAGLSEYNLEDALVKRVIIEQAAQVIVTADSSKLGHTSLVSVAPLSVVDVLVTDSQASPSFLDALREKGVEVILDS